MCYVAAHYKPIHWDSEFNLSLQIVKKFFIRGEGHNSRAPHVLNFFVGVARVEGNVEVNVAIGFRFGF